MNERYRRVRRRVGRLLRRGVDPTVVPDRYIEVDGFDPVSAVYRVEWRTVAMPIAVERLRWSRIGLPLDGDRNPFVRTVEQHRDGAVRSFAGSALESYYRVWQPATVGELLGLGADAGLGVAHPAASVGVPWMAEASVVDPAARLAYADKWARIESSRDGDELSLSHGHKLFGPVSAELGDLEFERYTSLAQVIAADGYVPYMDGEFLGVQILSDEDRWVALATGPGLHRAVAAAAVGVDPIIVAIDKHPRVIFRADVEHWPGVCNGLFTREGALAVFDRLIAGDAPKGFPT